LTQSGTALAVHLNAGSGLAVDGSGLSLLRTCGNGQVLKWNGSAWACDSDIDTADGGQKSHTMIVAASNSPASIKDTADYVADGTADQVEINAALTAAAGGSVYLAEGTYVANATILVPNNTTLAGAGKGTVIELADIDVSD